MSCGGRCMLRPALRCRLRSVRRCWLEPARRFWSRPAFDMAAVLRFGLLRRCAAVCAALRAASGAALRIGAGVGLLAAAGAAQRCGRRSATGCDWRMPYGLRQARRACSLGCGKGPGGGGGGGFRCGLVCTAKSCGNREDIYKLGCLLELCSFFSVAAAAR